MVFFVSTATTAQQHIYLAGGGGVLAVLINLNINMHAVFS